MKEIYQKIKINPDILKIFALITMTIDHICMIFFPDPANNANRIIGRTAFPIFSFLLMYHLYKKKIFKKYTSRLLIFGLLTSLLLLPFYSGELNILWTFLFPVLTLWIIENARKDVPWYLVVFIASFALCIFGILSPLANYGFLGYLYLLAFWLYFEKPHAISVILLLILALFVNKPMILGGIVTVLTTSFMLCIDMDKKYPRLIKNKWFFYCYYPLHLLLLYSIRALIMV